MPHNSKAQKIASEYNWKLAILKQAAGQLEVLAKEFGYKTISNGGKSRLPQLESDIKARRDALLQLERNKPK